MKGTNILNGIIKYICYCFLLSMLITACIGFFNGAWTNINTNNGLYSLVSSALYISLVLLSLLPLLIIAGTITFPFGITGYLIILQVLSFMSLWLGIKLRQQKYAPAITVLGFLIWGRIGFLLIAHSAH